ncbi:MAG: hypothetical protein E7191_03645 [Erysipelotrichaceae bacterium]|nr:hypothetical protein [Erysipelotrichaceae bacterium]MBQ9987079.1 hypothetical protein [Erysipelotrichales bacterium]MBR3693522.1 hypothetical protein [Erysipelotrichales bacterium]
MKRIWDAIAVCIVLLGISYIYEYQQVFTDTLEEKVSQFESDIAQELILEESYGSGKAVILNTKENKAGELGNAISLGLSNIMHVLIGLIGELVNMLLK